MGWTPEDLAILVPMLGRAHRVGPLLASIDASTPGCRVVFCLTSGDTAVIQAVSSAGREYFMVPPRPMGDYPVKINTGFRLTSEPLLFTGADDLEFLPGWFEAATTHLDKPGVGVVGTNDLGSPRVMAGEHATHFLITRDYVEQHGLIDEPGKIFHEGYWHEFVDDECVGTAKYRGAWAAAVDAHVRHHHPNWDASIKMDSLYQQQQRRIRYGQRIFRRRRRLWGG